MNPKVNTTRNINYGEDRESAALESSQESPQTLSRDWRTGGSQLWTSREAG